MRGLNATLDENELNLIPRPPIARVQLFSRAHACAETTSVGNSVEDWVTLGPVPKTATGLEEKR